VKIYTKRGDGGETDLFGGGRVGKEHARVETYGVIDELNAGLGVCAAESKSEDVRSAVLAIQACLFDLGSHFASSAPDSPAQSRSAGPGAEDVERLEAHIDAFEAELEPLERFILPGGTKASAAFHVARTVCRRAERRAVELHRAEPVSAAALRYLNRLSDLLFVMARVENRRAGVSDVPWEPRGD
jgi:cob(I)alamin adenosyltransferase